MYEQHKNEQYFYDASTLDHLANFLEAYKSPCCLCAPMLGKHLSERGSPVTILDIDQRFARTKGFRTYDINKPEWLGTEFDLIICDPPFFNVSLSQLFSTIRVLALNNFQQKVLVSYLSRRTSAIVGTFSRFQIEPTGYFPKYQTVRDIDRNKIEMFGNLDSASMELLNSSG